MSSKILTITDVTRDLISAAAKKVKCRYSSSVGSLYSINDKLHPHHAGTCTFFTHADEIYLVSAKHVFEYVSYRDVYICTQEGLRPLEVEAKQSIPSETGNTDAADVIIAKLESKRFDWLDQFQAINTDIEPELAALSATPSSLVSVFGFPHSRNKFNRHKRAPQSQLCLVSGSRRTQEHLHRKAKLQDTSHVFTSYLRKEAVGSDGRLKTMVKPQGMSGGLMFDMGILGKIKEVKDGATRPPMPIALITDFVRERQFVAGLKLSIVFDMIKSF